MFKSLMNIYFLETKLSKKIKVKRVKKYYNQFNDLTFLIDTIIKDAIIESVNKKFHTN